MNAPSEDYVCHLCGHDEGLRFAPAGCSLPDRFLCSDQRACVRRYIGTPEPTPPPVVVRDLDLFGSPV